jgi:hypothetical protein
VIGLAGHGGSAGLGQGAGVHRVAWVGLQVGGALAAAGRRRAGADGRCRGAADAVRDVVLREWQSSSRRGDCDDARMTVNEFFTTGSQPAESREG